MDSLNKNKTDTFPTGNSGVVVVTTAAIVVVGVVKIVPVVLVAGEPFSS